MFPERSSIGDHRGLEQDDALAASEHDRVRGPEIDRELLPGERASERQGFERVCTGSSADPSTMPVRPFGQATS